MKKLNKFLLLLFIMFILTLTFSTNANAITSYDSPTFSAEFYLGAHSDLLASFGRNYGTAYNHYISFGINEGRQTSLCFDAKYYLNTNADLLKAFGANYQLANNHFITFGIKEGRQGSPYFDVKYYLNNNADLKKAYGNNYLEAYNHFITFGIKEGRRGSEFFDVKFYLNNNPDLKKAFGNNYLDAYIHYIVFGIKEGRNPSENVNIRCYLNSYADLKATFKNDLKGVAEHYYIFGIREGRYANHRYSANTVSPTCTNGGKTTYTCNCGDSYIVTIPALGHSEKVLSKVPATCTDTGLTEGKQCSVCGTILVPQQTIPALGHDLSTKTTPFTCTEDGKKETTCSRCNYSDVEVLPAHHTVVTLPRKEPTCTEEGLALGTKCSVCNATLLEIKIPALGHTPSEPVVTKNATCADEGELSTYCSVCDELISTQAIAKVAHTDGGEHIDALEATCDTPGHEAGFKCSVCGEEVVKTTPALGHLFTITVLPTKATCTSRGNTGGETCSRCGYSTAQTIEKLAHDEIVNVVKQATCSSEGYANIKCSNCNYSSYRTIPKTEHSLVPITVKEATCTEPGYSGSGEICTVCGYTTSDVIKAEAKGHTPNPDIPKIHTDFKHDTDGFSDEYDTYTCLTCGNQYTEITKKVEHKTYRMVAYMEQHGTIGLINICSICHDAHFVQSISNDKLNGHHLVAVQGKKPTDSKDGYTNGVKCEECGVTVCSELHVWGEFSPVTEPDRLLHPDIPSYAKYYRTCKDCGNFDYRSSEP